MRIAEDSYRLSFVHPLPSSFHLYKEQERILKDHIYPISCSAGLEDIEVKGKCLYYLVVPRCGRNSNL